MNYARYVNRLNYLYWSSRRIKTASRLIWYDGANASLDDAGYCLDRPDKLEFVDDFYC